MPHLNVINTEKLAALDLMLQKFDPQIANEEEWAALNALSNRSRAEAWPDDPARPMEDTVKSLTNVPPFIKVHFWTVRRGAEMVARALVNYTQMESNQHLLQFDLYVVPELRRQGIGTELLKLVELTARQAERSSLLTQSDSAMPDGEAFLNHIGGQMGLAGVTNQLEIADLNRDLLRQWQQSAQERAADLELGFWGGPYPEAEIAAIATMKETMNSQPMGELEVEDIVWTPEQLRQIEMSLAARGVERWTMYVRDPQSGKFVGYTEVLWRESEPETLHQGDTAVVPSYRNRGLGRWLKAAMLDKVLQERPQIQRVRTGNAQSNDAMLNINHQMGFKPYKTESLWQIPLEKVQTYLGVYSS